MDASNPAVRGGVVIDSVVAGRIQMDAIIVVRDAVTGDFIIV